MLEQRQPVRYHRAHPAHRHHRPTLSVNAALAPGAAISGTITTSDKAAIHNLDVIVFTADGTPIDGTTTNSGAYTVKGIPPGTHYTICFDTSSLTGGAAHGYHDQCYAHTSWSGGDPNTGIADLPAGGPPPPPPPATPPQASTPPWSPTRKKSPRTATRRRRQVRSCSLVEYGSIISVTADRETWLDQVAPLDERDPGVRPAGAEELLRGDLQPAKAPSRPRSQAPKDVGARPN